MESGQLEREIASAMPAVLARMKQDVLDRVSRECANVATEEAMKATREWVLAEIVPEIRAQLEAGKPALVAKSAGIASDLGDALGKALVEQATKSLANTYTVKAIAEAMFKGY